jgi:hypothetical protein
MDFDFSDDQEQLRDAVRKWVDKGYDFDRRRAIVAAGGFDRAAYGAVADFFHFHVGTFSWYVFNLADVGIVAGVALLLYESIFMAEKTPGA